ncbi:uncharacterized protein UV8b_07989 [Ustilaginoidea virens]|uniref:Uncharacterized protein n=1 Tax=Ustilaginoidea virens TaxID=1159556 RepID=A0A063C8D8_USTVR|nr:uncharacterized protein UV8b_07989 [Ustilaginoidea virens]QUC23748.1 hypothetical protein UV8b_07989 [Ustilaginoidea virens]GAO17657.1 hypothetical protein UVI_02002180 [Ustilaginoidea virens]
MPEGHQSPPPERQSGKQLHEPPAEGFGTTQVGNKGEEVQAEIQNLESNPKGPLDHHLKDKFQKGEGNSVGASVQK